MALAGDWLGSVWAGLGLTAALADEAMESSWAKRKKRFEARLAVPSPAVRVTWRTGDEKTVRGFVTSLKIFFHTLSCVRSCLSSRQMLNSRSLE